MKNGKYFVKPWALMERECWITDATYRWIKRMEAEIPKDRIINIIDDEWDITTGMGSSFMITDEMLVGPAFEWGEEIEVSDDAKAWYESHYFMGIAPGGEYPYITTTDFDDHKAWSSFRYARPVQKPRIEITVKINGKESKLSDISEETLLKIRGLK